MTYIRDQKVRVMHPRGDHYVEGIILEYADFGTEPLWWVQTDDGVHVYEEDQLNSWNSTGQCCCGAAAVNSDKHSYYCVLYGI